MSFIQGGFLSPRGHFFHPRVFGVYLSSKGVFGVYLSSKGVYNSIQGYFLYPRGIFPSYKGDIFHPRGISLSQSEGVFCPVFCHVYFVNVDQLIDVGAAMCWFNYICRFSSCIVDQSSRVTYGFVYGLAGELGCTNNWADCLALITSPHLGRGIFFCWRSAEELMCRSMILGFTGDYAILHKLGARVLARVLDVLTPSQ